MNSITQQPNNSITLKLNNAKTKIGSVLIIGGGIAGMQASLDLAEAGFKVYLLEKKSAIGGKMVQLDKTFPTNDCAMCIVSPKLVDVGRNLNIEILTHSEIEEVKGDAGNFNITVLKKPRYVDLEKCTGCGECTKVCPIDIPSEFDGGLINRKAIYKLYPQGVPGAYSITKRGTSPCKNACPISQDVQGYIALISKGKYKEAINLIRKTNPFPAICGRVCPHPCEGQCKRGELDEPIAIRNLKRFAADYELKYKDEITEPALIIRKEKIAVIGSGPSGLTCAYDLARLGYPVTVFEKEEKIGGMMALSIPDFRLPKDILNAEIELIKKAGVEIKTQHEIIDLDALRTQYNAIYIAIGCQKSQKLNIPGEDLNGVLSGLEFLKNINLGKEIKLGEKVAVIGGGNVAMDAARSAKRLGAKEVSIIYRRSRLEMPASKEEIEEVEEEGINIHFLSAPNKIIGKDGRVCGIECVKMELGPQDDTGRRRPIKIPNSEFVIEIDNVISAIGQVPETSFLKDCLELTADGTIKVDPNSCMTSSPGIFAGGDVVLGPATVIKAISAGHKAAKLIDKYLLGEEMIIKEIERKVADPEGLDEYEKKKRTKMSKLPDDKRQKSFEEVNLGFTEEEAKEEAERCLSCGICCECYECVRVCDASAIEHEQREEKLELNVGAVILSPGYELFDANQKLEYGYSRFKNVITSLEFERILSSSGPTSGKVLRPSDNRAPKKIAFIQCVGSRCVNTLEYCSSVCCMYTTKQAIIAKEHEKNIKCRIFYIDKRYFGKEFEKYHKRAKAQYEIEYIRCIISKIYEIQKNKNLIIRYIADDGKIIEEEFNLIVLSVGIKPSYNLKNLSEKLNIELNEFGFVKTDNFYPNKTSREGIFTAGAVVEPKDIPETVADASASAGLVSALLADARGADVKIKKYPREKDIIYEEPRIGVFICNCGKNIGGIVNVGEVVENIKEVDDVVHCEEFLYACSQDSLQKIKEAIEEYKLNRIVVASCSPRTHQILFQDTIREARLNPYLFEMANIRDQCSWVHQEMPDFATEKAEELTKMAIAKARLLKPIKTKSLPVKKSALVIGGGLSGLISAKSIAEQGYEVHLIEKENKLGGNLKRVVSGQWSVVSKNEQQTTDGDVKDFLNNLIYDVENNPRITIYKNAEVKEVSGFVGNYKSVIRGQELVVSENNQDIEYEIEHGVIIVATGAKEYKPTEYLYGQDERVITQLELEEKISQNAITLKRNNAKTQVVMIQCVGSRNSERPYCSRVCCLQAIKNALKIKEIEADCKIYILHKDIRSYGFSEKYYKEAREKGIIFIRYPDEKSPEVRRKMSELVVFDDVLKKEVLLTPDLIVLSTGIVPREDNIELSKILKVPLTSDGFFLEAHSKLRPLDFSQDGIFLCGLASSPKNIQECISSALGSAMRAVTILSKDKISTIAEIAEVNERMCIACGICVDVCSYNAREIDEEKNVAKVIEFLCRGCGACISACPSGASRQRGYDKKYVIEMIEAVEV